MLLHIVEHVTFFLCYLIVENNINKIYILERGDIYIYIYIYIVQYIPLKTRLVSQYMFIGSETCESVHIQI